MTIGISPLRRSDFEDGGIVEFSMMERNECQEYYKEIKEMIDDKTDNIALLHGRITKLAVEDLLNNFAEKLGIGFI